MGTWCRPKVQYWCPLCLGKGKVWSACAAVKLRLSGLLPLHNSCALLCLLCGIACAFEQLCQEKVMQCWFFDYCTWNSTMYGSHRGAQVHIYRHGESAMWVVWFNGKYCLTLAVTTNCSCGEGGYLLMWCVMYFLWYYDS